LTYKCDQCGETLNRKADYEAHLIAHQEQKEKKEESMEREKEQQQSAYTLSEEVLSLFGARQERGLLSPERTEDEIAQDRLERFRNDVVRSMQVTIEVNRLTSPALLTELLNVLKDEQLRQLVALDWFDRVYRSLSSLHQLEELNRLVLEKQARDAGILATDQSLPEKPKTRLDDVLNALAARIGR